MVDTQYPHDLQELVGRVPRASVKTGLSLIIEKTKVMMLSKDRMEIKIITNGQKLQQVTSFVYLGSTLQENGDCEMDIRKRLGIGRSAMQSLSNMWKSRDITNDTKVQLMKSLILPIATYGCEG